jgi:hypothetical protein
MPKSNASAYYPNTPYYRKLEQLQANVHKAEQLIQTAQTELLDAKRESLNAREVTALEQHVLTAKHAAAKENFTSAQYTLIAATCLRDAHIAEDLAKSHFNGSNEWKRKVVEAITNLERSSPIT